MPYSPDHITGNNDGEFATADRWNDVMDGIVLTAEEAAAAAAANAAAITDVADEAAAMQDAIAALQAGGVGGEGGGPGVALGFALNSPGLLENAFGPAYTATALAHGDLWVPEWELKPHTTYNSGSKAIPTAANVSLYKAMSEKVPSLKARGHTLIWHVENPEWLANPTVAWTKATLEPQLEKMIKQVVTAAIHANPLLDEFDVVNEIASDSAKALRTTYLTTACGTTTISVESASMQLLAKCFIWAHEAAVAAGKPGMTLWYGEYSVETDFNWKGEAAETKAKGETAKQICEVLLTLGAPIAGIGIQGHRHVDQFPSQDEWTRHLEAFKALAAGTFKAQITEFDLNFRGGAALEGRPEGSLQTQAEGYAAAAAACEATGVERFICWGITDKSSWRTGTEGAPAGESVTSGARPLPFNTVETNGEYGEKPAFAVLAGLRASGTSGSSAIIALAARLSREVARLELAIKELGGLTEGTPEEPPSETEGARKMKCGLNGGRSHTAEWVPNKVNYLRNTDLTPIFTPGMSSKAIEEAASALVNACTAALAEGWQPLINPTVDDSIKWDTLVSADFAAWWVALVKAVVTAHPTAKVFEIGNEPFFHPPEASHKEKTTAAGYAKVVKACYEAVIAAGIPLAPATGGVTLLVATRGQYSEGPEKKWVADLAAQLGPFKSNINGFADHPYGLVLNNAGKTEPLEGTNGGFYSIVARHEEVLAAGFSTYACGNFWLTEFGFVEPITSIPPSPFYGVPDEATKAKELTAYCEKALALGYVTAVFPYSETTTEGGGTGFRILGTTAGTAYKNFAKSHA
jgi:GH35 family endo-1,4-beta-xylanase